MRLAVLKPPATFRSGTFKGRRRFSVRFTPSARAHLRGARRLKVRLNATATAGTTDRRTVTSVLTLSR